VQVVLQHTPSMQFPLEHWASSVQATPSSSLQTPEPSQAPLAHSLSGSWPFATSVQVPTVPARSQALHVAPHVELQHTLSAQLLLRH
jgi:hypothetical protein